MPKVPEAIATIDESFTGLLGFLKSKVAADAEFDIEEKVKWLEGQLKAMVDEGNLTMGEKQQLLEQVEQKIQMAQKEIDSATAEGKPKKVR